MKAILVILFVVTFHFAKSQKVECFVNLDSIQTTIADITSNNYYDSLISKFSKFDTTLTEEQYKLLYYGNFFYENYSPYGQDEYAKEFWELFSNKQYEEALISGKKSLQLNPINLRLSYFMAISSLRIGDSVSMRNYAHYQYFPLLNVIYKSCSSETRFIVISVSDEYEVLRDLKLKSYKQYLTGTTDVLKIEENEKGIQELYFDVSLPQASLSKELRKERKKKKKKKNKEKKSNKK